MSKFYQIAALCLFTVTLQAQTDSLPIPLFPKDTLIKEELNARLPVYNAESGDVDSDLEQQDIGALLQSSRDIFTATAGFAFGPARFRIRGYNSENMPVFMNGIRVNDLEGGRAIWNMWGGLNDITRNLDVRTGVTANPYHFGGIGGFTNINTDASTFSKGTRASYAMSNRAYVHRLMFTTSTGLMRNGWAFTFSGSRRYAEEGYVEGSNFDAWAYFMGAEKVFNKRNRIGLTFFGAPSVQGRTGLAIRELQQLTGNNFYNPLWGFQDGQMRNSRIATNHRPVAQLAFTHTPNDKVEIRTTAFTSFGRSGQTRLNWFGAQDPRPDFWRNIPSAFLTSPNDPVQFARLTDAWQNDINTRQINWDRLYFANSKNLFTVLNADGIEGNTVVGNRALYMVEEDRNDLFTYGINSQLTYRLSDNTRVSTALMANRHHTYYFRVVNDLLGADFWLDIDQFSQRDFNDVNVATNDLSRPNAVMRQGDRFGHDFVINIDNADAFVQIEHSTRNLDMYGAVSYNYYGFWRTGRMQNGRFPDNSLGDSERHDFHNYGLKGGITYKITGRHAVSSNINYHTRAPFARNAFVSPRTRDQVIDNLRPEEIFTTDLNYIIRYPRFKSRATIYHTQIDNSVWARNFFHDEFNTIINYTMTGVSMRHQGIEIGMEGNISSTVSATAVFATGTHIYNSRPIATISRDNSPEVFAEQRQVFWQNYRIGGMPHTAGSLGLRYNSPKFWFVGANANFFDDIYLDPNPDRRTAESLAIFVDTDPQVRKMLDQTRLDGAMTVDLFAGKSWRVKRRYFVNLNLSISNLLDNTEFATGGFEQLRYDPQEIDKFPPRIGFMFGRTFFAMVSVRF
ncbi:MAG: hypothetical protein ACXITV_09120 [Luteibaculaceae bacterium]